MPDFRIRKEYLSDELHQEWKIQAVLERTTMEELVIKALKEYLERNKK